MRSIAPPTKRKPPPFYLWAPIVTLLLVLSLEQTKLFERINLTTETLRISLRSSMGVSANPSPDLILVGVGPVSLQKGGRWPWNRSIHGNLLQLLSLAPPSVVAWDMLFVDKSVPEEDQHMAKSASITPLPVVIGAFVTEGTNKKTPKGELPKTAAAANQDLGITRPLTRIEGDLKNIPDAEELLLPIEPLRAYTFFGCVNANPQVDGIRHKIPLVLRYGNSLLPGLSLQTLIKHWSLTPDQILVRLGDAIYIDSPKVKRRIPIDDQGWYNINYRYELQESKPDAQGKKVISKQGFDSMEYSNLYGELARVRKDSTAPLPDVTGKIILVGQTAEGLSDFGPSPLTSLSPLVLVHMNTLNNILQEDYLYIFPSWLIWPFWLALSITTLAWLERKTFGISALIPCCIIVAYTLTAIAIFTSKSIMIPITMPVLGFFLLNVGAIGRRVMIEEQDKRRMRMAFTAYLAPNVLEKIIENRTSMKLGGERKEVAVLFSDIRGFTSLSETVGEEALVTQLNEYLTVMVDCVNRYGGTLHKFIGDAILAVWGDTMVESPKQNCTKALEAALAMRMELIKLNVRWKQENRPLLKIGIGINRGFVIVGNIGAPQRMEFTVIGDTVNTASRLEGVTKQYKLDLVVGDSFAEAVQDEYALQTIGLVKPPGKAQGVKIFHPMAPLSVFSAEDKAWLDSYEKASDLYFEKKFAESLTLFEKCHREKPENWPAELHVKLARDYAANPPDETWTGIRDVDK